MFTIGLNMVLPLWSWVEKTVYGVKTHWLSGKEKVPDTAVNKEGHDYSLLEHERIITIIFFEKVATVKSVSKW